LAGSFDGRDALRPVHKPRSVSVHDKQTELGLKSSRNRDLVTIIEKGSSSKKNFIQNNIEYVNSLSEKLNVQRCDSKQEKRISLKPMATEEDALKRRDKENVGLAPMLRFKRKHNSRPFFEVQ
jgi:hypothetical protein